MRKISDIAYGEAERQKLDLYLPDGDSFDLMVYFHGGGFKEGSKQKPTWIKYLANHGIAAAPINCRIYHNAKYSDFTDWCNKFN